MARVNHGYIGRDQVTRYERMRRRVWQHAWDHLGWRTRVRLWRMAGNSYVVAVMRAIF